MAMRALLQRVRRASVTVEGEVVASIGTGLCALVGVTHSDDEAAARKLAEKTWNLRIFPDARAEMNEPVGSHGGDVLVVSQFTLYADTRKGRRPSWHAAAPLEQAEPLVDAYAEGLRSLGANVATGSFGAEMDVELVNDGPVTLLLEV